MDDLFILVYVANTFSPVSVCLFEFKCRTQTQVIKWGFIGEMRVLAGEGRGSRGNSAGQSQRRLSCEHGWMTGQRAGEWTVKVSTWKKTQIDKAGGRGKLERRAGEGRRVVSEAGAESSRRTRGDPAQRNQRSHRENYKSHWNCHKSCFHTCDDLQRCCLCLSRGLAHVKANVQVRAGSDFWQSPFLAILNLKKN